MTHRVEQVESLLRRAVAEVLQRELSDPRIVGLVSVTDVDVSPDLKHAAVSVSILPEKYEKRSLAGLKHATMHIQKLTRKKVALRSVPRLSFRLDKGLKKQAEVLREIERGMERTASDSPPPTSPTATGDPADDTARD